MDTNWVFYLFTFLASIGGGIVQATTGFGFGIFVMVFFPLYLPLLNASALSSAISLFVSSTLVFKYRKHSQIKQVILPVICYLLISTSVILLAPSLDLHWLSIAFSVMMILLAIYMLFFSGKVKIRASAVTALSCSSLSGVASGLFGIGGPPMTLYYMTLFHDDKLAYMGTLQLFFWITAIANNVTRLSNGILNIATLLLVIPGFFGQALGVAIGSRILDKIPVKHFSTVVYGFLVVSGIITLVSNL